VCQTGKAVTGMRLHEAEEELKERGVPSRESCGWYKGKGCAKQRKL